MTKIVPISYLLIANSSPSKAKEEEEGSNNFSNSTSIDSKL